MLKLVLFFSLGTALAIVGIISPSIACSDDITPRVGDIEIFGLHRTSRSKVTQALGVSPGDHLPVREDAEEHIDKVSGISASDVEAICCDGGKTILYVGVEERNGVHLDFRPEPSGTVQLPPEILDKYQSLLDNIALALRSKTADEDLTHGYALSADPESRSIQESLIPLVDQNFAVIERAVRESKEADIRAAAVYVVQYASRTPHTSKAIGDTLQFALQDKDEDVRRNAMIALKAVMVGARMHPEQGIHITPTWFVELMNSLHWSDRRSASLALLTLTERRDADVLAQIRERALPSILEMARWHDLEHALPGFILAGRLAGLTEKEIGEAWTSGNREATLERAEFPNGKPGVLGNMLHRSSGTK